MNKDVEKVFRIEAGRWTLVLREILSRQQGGKIGWQAGRPRSDFMVSKERKVLEEVRSRASTDEWVALGVNRRNLGQGFQP